MTWIEVIDSAVKIGLGALISAGFMAYARHIEHKNKVEILRIEAKKQLLHDISSLLLSASLGALDFLNSIDHTPGRFKELEHELRKAHKNSLEAMQLCQMFGHEGLAARAQTWAVFILNIIGFFGDQGENYADSALNAFDRNLSDFWIDMNKELSGAHKHIWK